jgi:hypothetical protein
MNPAILPWNIVVDGALLVVTVGLMVRGRWRLSVSFAVYTVLILVRDVLITLWPERFYFQTCWFIFQSVLDILKFGIALEVGWRTFGAFPGAASIARKTGVVILALTAAAAASLPLASPDSTSFQTAVASFHPRLLDGTIWLMAAILVIAWWFRVPVHRFHAALLTSLAVYLVFFTWLLRLFAWRDFETTRLYVNAIDPIVFFLVTCRWVHIAWRAENEADRAHMATLRTLQVERTERRDVAAQAFNSAVRFSRKSEVTAR